MDSFDLHKGFAVAWISRVDIKEHVGLTDEAVSGLTDHEMKQIASMMEDLYVNQGYWEDLHLCVNRFLREKEYEEHGTLD
jgi:hypothetical protein